jgi:hypothetical protein
MTAETFNHADRSGFIERLGQLSGKTSWREPGGAGYTPFVSGSMSPENSMLLALSMARRNPRDVGPEIAYSVGTGQPHHRQRVVYWLAEKLLAGAGITAKRLKLQINPIAGQAYDLVIGTQVVLLPITGHERESTLLINIGAGWLWMTMEAAVERAERALRSNS